MQESTYQQAIELIEQNRDIVNFAPYGKGITDEWIQKAEQRLKVKLPPTYIWWLKNYSGGDILGDEIYSIYQIDFDQVTGGDLVYMNELNRKDGFSGSHQLIIQETDFGEVYFFHLEEKDENGEYPVYVNDLQHRYAGNFLEFLIKKIKEL